MKAVNKIHFKLRTIATALLMSITLSLFGNITEVFAHGGEDHGDEKPAVATTENGTVSRTARLGDFEILIKHSVLEPDTAASARLFLTQFATNEPAGNADLKIEIESANGIVTEVPVEKAEAAGSFILKIPALPEGSYTLRTISTIGGKAETTTFSGIEVAHKEAAAGSAGGGSWAQTAMTALLFLVGLSLFGVLVYFAARVVKEKPLREEAVSA